MFRMVVPALAFVLILGCGGSDVKNDPILGEPDNIYVAAKAGDLEAVRGFIEANQWDPHSPDGAGITPLNYAAASGNVEIIRLMVENGADVNQIDVHHDTPLKCAEKAGKSEAVAVLKELGATE